MQRDRVIVVGAGLAGLSCAFELVKNDLDVTVLESRDVLGGRTSSWVQDGMAVESGLHKFLGIYRALPELLRNVGVSLHDMLTWVDELAIWVPGEAEGAFTVSPYHHPIGTAWSLLGNNQLLPGADKAKLMAFAAAGAARCVKDPLDFDQISVAQYAAEFGISDEVIRRVLFTSTQAILFMPADQFSAYAAFAPAVEGLKRLLTFRLGAFNGGMTEVMIDPIAKAITDRGGVIRRQSPITDLLVENRGVVGVATNESQLRADHVVLAVSLKPAQDLLRRPFGADKWFQPMLSLPSLSAATIQFELDEPLLPTDRTNFSPTSLCCFAEQSHTTFQHAAGRFSVILYPPEEFLDMAPEDVFERGCQDADRLGLPLRQHVVRYRVVNHAHDFYALRPGTESLRPEQETPVKGLSLAGDYTKQPFVASMEGAVVSGQKAAAAVQKAIAKRRA